MEQTAQIIPSGTEGQAGGDALDQANKDFVKYETYQRIVSEKKRRDEQLGEMSKRVQELEGQQKMRHEQELREKEDYKKLLDLRDKELLDTKSKLNEFSVMQKLEKKAQAFVNAVGGLKRQEYMNLVDFDQIIMTDEGSIDQMSLEKYKDEWAQKFPETLADKRTASIPVTSPQSAVRPADDKQALLERISKSNLF